MCKTEWAKNEVMLACEKENPNWDGEPFDYGCSCYQSALKAYESLAEDGHSGYSFNVTKNILIRLMNGQPLLPITDNDFAEGDNIYSDQTLEADGLVSYKQCPRMSSLFRKETLDGDVYYSDIDRCYGEEIDNECNCYTSRCVSDIVNDLYPITMPYMPLVGKYKVYTDTFLVDEANGDFDTRGFIYLITPKGERVEINKYQAEVDGKFVDITKEEFEDLKLKKIK